MRLVLNHDEIKNLIICGKILSLAIAEVIKNIKPGINAATLDKIAETYLRKNGARPSFLNYGSSDNSFPASICLSINNEVVHGIPSKNKIIKHGDIVSVDIGAEYMGVYTDMAKTILVDEPKNALLNKEKIKLIQVTYRSLEIGIQSVKAGVATGDIGYTIQNYVEENGFSVVKALVGHGIGLSAHQDPQIPNFGTMGTGFKLKENMAIAIEPMVNAGTSDVITSDDGWTVKTHDGSLSAHFEHTILVKNKKSIIITA